MFGTDRTRLAAAAVLAFVCLVLLTLPGLPAAIVFPAAALFVLVLPGYAVGRALFGRSLAPAERLTITLGLSLSITIISGLVLNLEPHGIGLPQWGGLLGGLTLAAAGIAWLRDLGSPTTAGDRAPADRAEEAAPILMPADAMVADPTLVEEADTVADTAAEAGAAQVGTADAGGAAAGGAAAGAAGSRIPRPQLVMLGAAACILLASLGLARIGAAVEPYEPFTALWMIPAVTGTSLDLGFRNDENRPTTYRLLVTQDGRTIAEWVEITLQDGETWAQSLALNFRRDTHRIRATLYRPGDVEPYREAHADVRFRPNAGQTPLPSGAPPTEPTPGPAASPAGSTSPTTSPLVAP
jgi:hypothetical protein